MAPRVAETAARSGSVMDQVAYELAHALSLMRAALSLLDHTNVAHDVAAHLDLAICRLSELVGEHEAGNQTSDRNSQSH